MAKMLPPHQSVPLPSRPVIIVAALMALVCVGVAIAAGLVIMPLLSEGITAWFVPLLFAVIVFVILIIPLTLALYARKSSQILWARALFVEARDKAADARHYAFTTIGLAGFLLPCLILMIFVTINDAIVYKTFLRGDMIISSMIDISRAFLINITIACAAQSFSLILGLFLAMGRLLQGTSFRLIRGFCICYVDIFRSLPAIVIIYLICFGVPLTGIPLISEGNPMLYAIIALSLTYGAYNGEMFRAGIESIHASQIAAAQSLGLQMRVIFCFVILPQALRRIAGPMLGYFIALQKDTALVNIVGIVDAFTQAKIYAANFYNLSSITVVCILFIAITVPQTRLVDYLVRSQDKT